MAQIVDFRDLQIFNTSSTSLTKSFPSLPLILRRQAFKLSAHGDRNIDLSKQLDT